MGPLARLWPIVKIAARTPSIWSALIALLVGSWFAHGIGHDTGYAAGVEVGMKAERMRQADAALKGTREAIEDREAAEDETIDDFNRAGGDLERLCKADPACRDRHELRLD